MKEAVFSLPPLQREALILFEYEGLSLSEVAEIAGTDVGAIKGAREGLRRILRPYLESNQELNGGREIVILREA